MPVKKEKIKKAVVEQYFKVNNMFRQYEKVRNSLNAYLKKNMYLNQTMRFGKLFAKVIKTHRTVVDLDLLKRKFPKEYKKCLVDIPVLTLEVIKK